MILEYEQEEGVDQATLHDLPHKLHDPCLPLLSVNRIEPDQKDAPDVKQ